MSRAEEVKVPRPEAGELGLDFSGLGYRVASLDLARHFLQTNDIDIDQDSATTQVTLRLSG